MEQITSKTVWDEFVRNRCGHPLQLWGWGAVKEMHGWKVIRYIGSNKRWGAQVLVKALPWPAKSFAYVARGPIGEWGTDELTVLADEIKHRFGSITLSIEPQQEDMLTLAGWKRASNTVLVPRTLILDLAHSEEELLGAMAKKTRQYIRKSLNTIQVRKITTAQDIDECLAVYRQTAKRANFALHDDGYYHDIATQLEKNSQLYGAYHGDELVAFLWLVASNEIAFELYGGITDQGQQLKANYGLKWKAILDQQKHDVSRYDLNGLLNDGISTFKQSFASHENVLVGTYDRPLSLWYPVWTYGLPVAKKIVRKLRR